MCLSGCLLCVLIVLFFHKVNAGVDNVKIPKEEFQESMPPKSSMQTGKTVPSTGPNEKREEVLHGGNQREADLKKGNTSEPPDLVVEKERVEGKPDEVSKVLLSQCQDTRDPQAGHGQESTRDSEMISEPTNSQSQSKVVTS